MKEQYSNLDWYKSAHNDLGIDSVPRDDNFATKLSICMPISIRSEALEIMANTKKQSAYSRTQKSYVECPNNATSEEDVNNILETLNALHGRISGRKKN